MGFGLRCRESRPPVLIERFGPSMRNDSSQGLAVLTTEQNGLLVAKTSKRASLSEKTDYTQMHTNLPRVQMHPGEEAFRFQRQTREHLVWMRQQ